VHVLMHCCAVVHRVGILSAGMVLCSSNEDHTAVDPISPPEGAAIGERITFEGHEGVDSCHACSCTRIQQHNTPALKTGKSSIWSLHHHQELFGHTSVPAGEPEAQLNPKKKVFDELAPSLKTTADGVAVYQVGIDMTCCAHAQLRAASISVAAHRVTYGGITAQDIKFMTSAGPVTSKLPNGSVR
jgi:hypothetical protein